MATAVVEIPPSNHILPGSHHLPTGQFPTSASIYGSPNVKPETSPESTATEWLSVFNRFLGGENLSVDKVFVNEACWRDLLCMTWDFHTLQGPEKIATYVRDPSKKGVIRNITLPNFPAHKSTKYADCGGLKVVQAFLDVETANGRGEGLVRLVCDQSKNSEWKAFTLFTTLKELKGYEETIYSRRPNGATHDAETKGLNWKERLIAQQNFEGGREPAVLIIGMICLNENATDS